MTEAPITRHEREDLQRLVRQREKALLAGTKQRTAECWPTLRTRWAVNIA